MTQSAILPLATTDLFSSEFDHGKVSVVIPTLNEAHALPANLEALVSNPDVHELIIVDGGSDDGTLDYVHDLADGRVQLYQSDAGRGRQMNAGAAQASGDWLIFHHADSRLPTNFMRLIEAIDYDLEIQWGGFEQQFAPANWKLNLISKMHRMRARLSGAVYGDQSMYVRRQFFEALGGFQEDILEDLDFSDRASSRCPAHLMSARVLTDSRKFRQLGEFRALSQVVSIVLRYERDKPIEHNGFFQPYR